MRTPRLLPLLIALGLVASACSAGSGSTPVVTGISEDGSIVVGGTTPPNTPPPSPVCQADAPVIRAGSANPSIEYFDEGPGLASVHMAQATFDCATHVVIVSDLDINRVAVAAALAASIEAPLLIGSAEASGLLGFETERLGPMQIIVVGDDIQFEAPEWSDVVTLSGDTASLAAQINSLAGFTTTLPLPAEIGAATLITTVNAIESGAGLVPPALPAPAPTDTTAADTPTTVAASVSAFPIDVPSLATGTGETGVALLIDGNNPVAAIAGLVSAHSAGAMATLIDDSDLRAVPGAGRALQSMSAEPGSIQVFGAITTDSEWQLNVLRFADELPGGGYLVLPRFMVALYGNPLSPDLGVLGEYSTPEAAATRAKELASGFGSESRPRLPAFEIITTVASGGPGGDGNYSTEWEPSVYVPWIETAAREGVYVILDLQPGRADFLTQAKLYESLLLYPHVGLALDPEWRLEPDQVHLQQVGHVEAAEVNSVIEWLADLVRDNNLPQKVLLLHQFQRQMIRDRDTLEYRPELQTIVQMDGFGAFESKLFTWDGSFESGEPYGVTIGAQDWFAWGWKNFFDEDTPGGGQVWAELAGLEPQIVYVSYQ